MNFIYYEGSDTRKTCTGSGDFTGRKAMSTGCGIQCVSDWKCSEWGECKNGTQTRLCFDNNG